MFACLYLPPPADARGPVGPAFLQLARDFSPRVQTHGERLITLDIGGLHSLIGPPRAIGEELRRSAADAGLRVHVAIAATSTTAMLLARARAGLTVVPIGAEAATLAALPLRTLAELNAELTTGQREAAFEQLTRWGLRTLGDLAALPPAELSARLGQDGVRWQRAARGEEQGPLVPTGIAERFDESLDLEWPIEGLEPLSFVFARLFDPLCDRLERADRGAVALHVELTLVTRAVHARTVELPAPMRDARVLRTLALLDLEAAPPPAAIDRVRVAVDVTEGHILQFGLFARALPAEKLATLMARLGALMGRDHVGAASLVDSYRPGAFAMARFEPSRIAQPDAGGPDRPVVVLRRFRMSIPARVVLEQGRPVRVTTDRRGLTGGDVLRCDGPWRSSGDWWQTAQARQARGAPPSRVAHAAGVHAPGGWSCDEWDVVLSDGGAYRLSEARGADRVWFVDGMLD